MVKQKFPKGIKGDKHTSSKEHMPNEIANAMLKIMNKAKGTIFREDVMEKLLWQNPSWAKYLIRSKVTFGMMFNPIELDKISSELPVEEQRAMLISSGVDVSALRCATKDKITGMKRSLRRKGVKMLSNSDTGLCKSESANPITIAKAIYYHLRWNSGQLPEWHDALEKFTQEHGRTKLVARLKNYSKVAMDKEELPALAEMLKEISGKEE